MCIIINVYNYVYMIIYVYLLTYTSLNKIESNNSIVDIAARFPPNGLIMTRSPSWTHENLHISCWGV